jgi:hypothetical protein
MANLATINNNLLADSGIDPLSVVIGSGTANQIAYWIDADNIGALTTATYPSLTELSYVKGVTSSIQTQLNGKQPLLTNPVTGTGSAGQVAYWSSASAITGENDFIWDATNNRLAIGVVTPAASLHIEGAGSTYSVPSVSNVPGIYVQNTNSASTSANAFISLRTTGASGGNPIVSWDIGGIIGWSAGIDNADSDSFKIANYWGNVDTSTRLRISLAGGLRLYAYGSGTFTGTVAYNLAVDSSGNIIEVVDGGGTVTGTGTTNYVPKWTSASVIGNSQILDNGTSVGIGAASPGSRLTIYSGAALTGRAFEVYYGTDNNQPFNIGINRSSGNAWIGWNAYQSTGDTQIYQVTNVAARISGGGGLLFQVAASGTANNAITWVNALTIATTGAATFIGDISTSGALKLTYLTNRWDLYQWTDNTLRFNYNGAGADEFTLTTDGNGTFRGVITGSSIVKTGGTSSQYLMADGSVSTLTNPVTGTGTTNYIPKWTSASAIGNSLIIDDGTNVGINVALPKERLQVNGAIAATGTATTSFGSSSTLDWFSTGTRIISRGANTTTRGTLRIILESSDSSLSSDALVFSNAAAATFISSVTATSFVKTGGTSSQYLMADGSVSTLTNPVTGTGTTNYVTKWTSASAVGNSVLYDNGTSVAIGTVTPVTLLHIQGSGSTYSTPESNNVPGIYVYNSTNNVGTANAFIALRTLSANGGDPFVSWDIDGVIGWSAGIDNSDDDKFKIANSWANLDSNTRFTIDGFGNIGVGTSTPNGSAAERTIVLANNTATYYLTNGANTLRGIFALGNATSEVFIGTQTNHNFHLRTNDTARLWVTNGGNLGLGTTFVLGSYLSSATQSGVFQTATSVAKAATASDNILAFFGSNDAANPLGLFIGMYTGATAGARMVRLQGTEIGASANHILIQPDGAYVGIGQYFTSATFNQPTTLLHISNSNTSYTAPSTNNLPSIYLHNTNNASTTAHAILTLRTKEAGGGNPFISFDVENVTGWAMGIDNADSDSFKLNWGWSSLTSATALRFSTTTLAATFYGPISGTNATLSDYLLINKAGGLAFRSYYGSGNNRSLDVNVDGSNGDARLTFNTTYSSGWKYYLANYAAMIHSGDGLIFSVAPVGTANAAITWKEAFTISSTGVSTFTESVSITKTKSGTGVENYNLLNFRVAGTGAIGDSGNIAWRSSDNSYTIASINGISGANNVAYGSIGFSVRNYFSDTLLEAMRIDNKGNIGIGVVPDFWGSGWRALQVGASGAIAYTGSGANDFSFSTNSYFDSTDNRWEYRYTGDGAARYSMTALTREHRWFIAPVGTAGGAITWTQAMTLDASGNLGLGATPVVRLTVSGGSMNIASASTGNSNTLYFGDEVQRSSGKCIFMESYYLKIQGHRNEGVILQGTDGNSNIQTFASFYGSSNGSYPNTVHIYPSGGKLGIATSDARTTLSIGSGSFVDSNVPAQMSTGGGGTGAYFGWNKNGGYGLLVGMSNGLDGWTAGIVRQITTDPLYFIVNNNTIAQAITSTGRIGIGTTFTIGSYMDSASQGGVIQLATNIGKTSTARDIPLAFFGSNDASYPLGLYVGMRTGASTAARQLKLQGTEIGLSPNAIIMQPDGANIGLGTAFGTVGTTPDVLLHISNNGSSYTAPSINNVPCIYLNNTNGSSTNAHSILVLRTLGGNGGNPFISFDINGVQGWAMGIDNADSDKFKLSYGWSSVSSDVKMSFATSGAVTFSNSVTASSFFEPSDIRLKDIIERNPLVSLDIDLVKYKKKDKDGIRYGYIAQEVKALIPELAEGDDILSLNYQDIHSIKIAALEAKIKELESQLKNK